MMQWHADMSIQLHSKIHMGKHCMRQSVRGISRYHVMLIGNYEREGSGDG